MNRSASRLFTFLVKMDPCLPFKTLCIRTIQRRKVIYSREDDVELFQRLAGRLRTKEVHWLTLISSATIQEHARTEWNLQCIEHCEEDVNLPTNTSDRLRRHHDSHKSEYPF